MGLLEDLASIIANSKTGDQLPVAASISNTDYVYFYNDTTKRTERILKSALSGNVSFSEVFMGTVSSAGGTTTDTELINHINTHGFTITAGQVKIIRVITYIDTVTYSNSFWLLSNAVGTYGNSGTVLNLTDLYQFERIIITQDDETITKIDLGDIGSDTIEDAINNGNDLQLNDSSVYVFSCVMGGSDYNYLYTGTQPILLGAGNNQVTAADFVEISSNATSANTLSGLLDTTISSPTNGQILAYNTSTSKWENVDLSGGGDMLKSVYDPQNKNADAFEQDNMTEPTTTVTTLEVGDNVIMYNDVDDEWVMISRDDLLGYFGGIYVAITNFLQEKLSGTTVFASDVSGTYNVDWNAASVWDINCNGNTTLADTNLPASSTNKVINIYMDFDNGTEVVTLPGYWVKDPDSDDLDATQRVRLTVEAINNTSDVTYYVKNLG